VGLEQITPKYIYFNKLVWSHTKNSRHQNSQENIQMESPNKSQGIHKYRWKDNIKQDIWQMKVKNWIICVQDREKWKEVVERAKTFCD
jgi:hypothetical protein